MFQLGSLLPGVSLSLTGLLLIGLVFLILRTKETIRIPESQPDQSPHPTSLVSGNHPYLVVESGGRIREISDAARKIFHLADQTIDLELLSKKIRPTDALIEVCSTSDSTEVLIDGTPFVLTSFSIHDLDQLATLVTIHPVQDHSVNTPEFPDTLINYQLVNQLYSQLRPDLSLVQLIETIIQALEEIIPADLIQIMMVSPDKKRLIPYRFPFDQKTEANGNTKRGYPLNDGYSGHMVKTRLPLLIPNTNQETNLHPVIDRSVFQIGSFLGVPIVFNQRVLGTIELVSRTKDHFSESDLKVLTAFEPVFSTSLYNHSLYQEQQKRSDELEIISQLAQKIITARDENEIFVQITDQISGILNSSIVGFLTFDEARSTLAAHSPFIGLPGEFVKLYQTTIAKGSSAEKIIRSQKPIVTQNAVTDPNIAALGLDTYAQAAGIISSVLMPLCSSGRFLGYLQVANKQNGQLFTTDDTKLLSIIASQAAPIIENMGLIKQSIKRALRAESLRRIASLAGSEATKDEILKYTVLELGRLFNADFASLILLDERKQTLTSHQSSAFIAERGGAIPDIKVHLDDPNYPHTVTYQKHPILSADISVDENVTHFYLTFMNQLGAKSVMVLPLLSRNYCLGELMISSHQIDQFSSFDLQFTTTIAKQLAVIIDNEISTTPEVETLAKQIDQLKILNRLTHEIISIPDDQNIYNRILGQLASLLAIVDTNLIIFDQTVVGNEYQIKTQHGSIHLAELLPHQQDFLLQKSEASAASNPIDNPVFMDSAGEVAPSACYPIENNQGVIGILTLFSNDPSIFNAVNHQTVDAFCTLIAFAIRINARETSREKTILIPHGNRTGDINTTMPGADDTSIWSLPKIERTIEVLNSTLQTIGFLNQDINKNQMISVITESLVTQFGFDVSMAIWEISDRLVVSQQFGNFPETINLNALLGQPNPFSGFLLDDQIIFVSHIEDANDHDWLEYPILNALGILSFLAIPVIANNEKIVFFGGALRSHSAIQRSDFQPISDLSSIIHQKLIGINGLNELRKRKREYDLVFEFTQALTGLNPDEIFKTLLSTVFKNIPNNNAGMILQPSDNSQYLVPRNIEGYPNSALMSEILFPIDTTLPGEAFQYREMIYHQEVDFPTAYLLPQDDLIRYRDATDGSLPISTVCIPIQITGIPFGVLVLDNFKEFDAYAPESIEFVKTLVHQAALMLENFKLIRESRQRADQLTALSGASSRLTSSLRKEELLSSLIPLLTTFISFDTATIWIRQQDSLTIADVSGFENNFDLMGISVQLEDSQLFQEMISTNKPILVGNKNMDPRFPVVESQRFLSWVGIPMISKGKVLGVMAIEKLESDYFSPTMVQALTTFASQAAIAYDNAELYQSSLERATELDHRSRRLANLNQFSIDINKLISSSQIIQRTGEELRKSTGASGVLAVLRLETDEQDKSMYRVQGIQPESQQTGSLEIEIRSNPLFERLEQSYGIYHTTEITKNEFGDLFVRLNERDAVACLVLPMIVPGKILGFFILFKSEATRFDIAHLELSQIIVNQASIAIQTTDLLTETRRLAEQLEERVEERTKQFFYEHQRAQTLVKIMGELAESLDLDQVIQRTLEIINESTGAQQSSLLIYKPDQRSFHYQASLGYAESPPRGGRPTELNIENSLAGWVIQNRQSVWINDLSTDQRWTQLDSYDIQHRSAIASPLMVGEELLGVLLLFHPQTDYFTEDNIELVQATANQMAISINNAELFKLIRDQAEGLGKMLRNQQIESSKSNAILEAVADGVLVTDPSTSITLFNQSAERILGLRRDDVLGKSLDQFIGLFDTAGDSWTQTIQQWTGSPIISQDVELFSEQLTLEDGRVVSVHLAPVQRQDEFFGTVSVFRDITHQVEVDRLKSEFVATVSHELRTPMTSIRGYVDVLLMGAAGEISDKQKGFLQIVKDNTDRLNILVNDLLDVSRIEAGRIDLSYQAINLNNLLLETIREYQNRSQKESKGITYDFYTQSTLPRVSGDLDRVRQIIQNLMENAYLYTPKNGNVIISLHTADDRIQVDIQDNGIGIAPKDQEMIFQRFYRGEDPLVLASAGNGLGLAIVRQLVELHKGEIWFESTGIPGEGSIFSFTLPLYQDNVETNMDTPNSRGHS